MTCELAPGSAGALAGRLTAAAGRLAAAGVDSPDHDAAELAAVALGCRRGDLAVVGADLAGPAGVRFTELVRRRERREPLQYLTGRAGFRRLELAVGPGVFVPRPETELVVDEVLGWLEQARPPRPLLVVDLCAGSGAIGLSVAAEVAGAHVHLVEPCAPARRWLAVNVRAVPAAPGSRVRFLAADAAGAADPGGPLAGVAGRVNVVTANPPYLEPAELSAAPPEVAVHEPRAALAGGPDGLEVIRPVFAAAAALLRPGGLVVVEHGDRQGSAVAALARRTGFAGGRTRSDLAGRDRLFVGVRGGGG